MILAASEIDRACLRHELAMRGIVVPAHLEHALVEPYDPKLLNPASYDLTLGDEACIYTVGAYEESPALTHRSWTELPSAPRALDSREPNHFLRFRLAREGFRIPGADSGKYRRILLLHTREVVAPGPYLVGVVDGKSSLGRLGLVVHATAGYVDPGFVGQVTLEVAALGEDVIVYPGMRIAQVRFQRLEGHAPSYQERGNYVDHASMGPVPSRSYLQFERESKTDPVPPPSEPGSHGSSNVVALPVLDADD